MRGWVVLAILAKSVAVAFGEITGTFVPVFLGRPPFDVASTLHATSSARRTSTPCRLSDGSGTRTCRAIVGSLRAMAQSLNTQLLAQAAPIVRGVARKLAYGSNGVVDAQDLEQELWTWCVKHPHHIEDWIDRTDGGLARAGRSALRKTLKREGVRYVDKERDRSARFIPLDVWRASWA